MGDRRRLVARRPPRLGAEHREAPPAGRHLRRGRHTPQEASYVLDGLAESDDPEIAEAVLEATSMADGDWVEDDEDFDGDDET